MIVGSAPSDEPRTSNPRTMAARMNDGRTCGVEVPVRFTGRCWRSAVVTAKAPPPSTERSVNGGIEAGRHALGRVPRRRDQGAGGIAHGDSRPAARLPLAVGGRSRTESRTPPYWSSESRALRAAVAKPKEIEFRKGELCQTRSPVERRWRLSGVPMTRSGGPSGILGAGQRQLDGTHPQFEARPSRRCPTRSPSPFRRASRASPIGLH